MNRNIVIVLFFLVGTISILPYVIAYLYAPAVEGEQLHYFYQDSELVYLARIREILEGHTSVSSPIFHEYKNTPNLHQPYSEWLYALATFGYIEWVPLVALLSKFVLPGILAVLVFLCTQRLIRIATETQSNTQIYLALFLSILVTLGVEFNHVGFWRQLFVHDDPLLYLSLWTRIVNPIMGALGFFFITYAVLALYERMHSFLVIAAGLVFGLMSGYVFSFALTGLMLGGMFLCAAYAREWGYARSLFYIACIATLVNAFYFYHILFGVSDIAALTKSGLLLTHNALHNKILYLTGGILVTAFIYSYYADRARVIFKNRAWQWSLVCVVSGLVLLNQQIITGKTIWPGHFVQYTNPISYIIFFVALFTIGHVWTQKYIQYRSIYERFVRWGTSFGIIAVLCVNLVGVYHATLPQDLYMHDQRYAPALAWLKEHAPDPCVVFVYEKREHMEKYIPAYTQCDLYHSTFVFFAVPEERVMHNYITYMRIHGVPKEKVAEYLASPEAGIHRFFFEDWVDLFPNNNDTWLLNTKAADAEQTFQIRYSERIQKAYEESFAYSLNELLHMYQINYIMYDAREEVPSADSNIYPETFRSNDIVIRKVP